MAVLRLEVSPDGDDSHTFGELRSGDQYGSISDEHEDGSSDVYIFGVDPIKNVGEIKRSIGGIDIETGQARQVNSLGLEVVARLSPGQHHEMMVIARRSLAAVLIRFTYNEG